MTAIMSALGLGRVWAYLALAAGILGGVALVLMNARAAGRQAEQMDRAQIEGRIKDAQLKAMADAPRTFSGVARKLRDGRF